MKIGKTIERLKSTWRPAEPKPVDMFERLSDVDDRLGDAGFPRMSPFWRSTMKRWLRSGKRWIVGRVGRRGGKGIMSAKLAACFALHAPIVNLAPGERCFVELLSVDREEASSRLGMIAKALEALGVPHKALGEEIQLTDPKRPITIRVRAASIRAVGGTAILILLDEMARWRDVATGSNPAREVESAIKAELLSQPHGRGCMWSAPFGENDLHAERFDEGETDAQCVAHAPTWIANPSISEADTKALESNPAVWERDYAARPTAHVTAIASKAEIAALRQKGVTKIPRIPGAVYIGVEDPSGLRNDAWVAAVFACYLRSRPDGGVDHVIVQVAMVRFAPTFFSRPTFDEACAGALALFRDYAVTKVRTDGHSYEARRQRYAEAGVTLLVTKQTPAAITQRIESLQARIANGTIALLDDDVQAQELGAAQLVTHTNGRRTLRAPERKGAHDDHVSAILLAMEDGDANLKNVRDLPPITADSDVIVQPGSITFSPGEGITVRPPRYFAKLPNGDLAEKEAPYGSRAFIDYAVRSVARGRWTESIRRWCIELGHEPRPDIDPQKLDPHAPMVEPGPAHVHFVDDEDPILRSARRHY